jgi:hypothetical protein
MAVSVPRAGLAFMPIADFGIYCRYRLLLSAVEEKTGITLVPIEKKASKDMIQSRLNKRRNNRSPLDTGRGGSIEKAMVVTEKVKQLLMAYNSSDICAAQLIFQGDSATKENIAAAVEIVRTL